MVASWWVSVLFVRGVQTGGAVEIDFAFQNGKLCSERSGGLEWRRGTDVELIFVSAVLSPIGIKVLFGK